MTRSLPVPTTPLASTSSIILIRLAPASLIIKILLSQKTVNRNTNAAVDKARKDNPKSKFNTKGFQQRFRSARGGRERLQALIFAKNPAVLDLAE